jgi:prophage tail gpP-like protein
MSDSCDIAVVVNGTRYSEWMSYQIDSDLLTFADAFSLTLANPDGVLAGKFKRYDEVKVLVDGTVQMTGWLDEIDWRVDPHQGSVVELTGRDRFGQLCDCCCDPHSYYNIPIQLLAEKMGSPYVNAWQFHNEQNRRQMLYARAKHPTAPKANTDTSATLKTANETRARSQVKHAKIEPGDTRIEVLKRGVESCGLWTWCAADGTGVLARPNYAQAALYHLYLYPPSHPDRHRNNVLSAQCTHSGHERYTVYRITGHMKNSVRDYGEKITFDRSQKDVSLSTLERQYIFTGHGQSYAEIKLELDTDIARRAFESESLTYVVPGHKQGQLYYQIDTLCSVDDKVTGYSGVYYVTGRRFRGDTAGGQTTEITLRQKGIWLA